jgi:hypothetical protein
MLASVHRRRFHHVLIAHFEVTGQTCIGQTRRKSERRFMTRLVPLMYGRRKKICQGEESTQENMDRSVRLQIHFCALSGFL